MKILIISDTHRNINNAVRVIECIKQSISAIIHLGDCDKDAERIMKLYPEIPMYYVYGNCDFCSATVAQQIISFNRVKVFITHGHKYDVKWEYDKLAYAARENQAQVALFGHTHMAVIKYIDNILLMNPGSISLPRDNYIPKYGILDINDDGLVKPSIVGIYGKNDYRIIK